MINNFPQLSIILSSIKIGHYNPPLLVLGARESDWKQILVDFINILANKAKIKHDEHPDIIFLSKNKKDQSIGVEQTRNFIKELSLSSYELPIKIGIVPEAHLLNHSSQNSLLKTLEEPEKNRLLFLGASSKSQMLPTIVSRCTIINSESNTLDQLNDFISTNYPEIPPDQRKKYIRFSYYKISRLQESLENKDYFEEIHDILNSKKTSSNLLKLGVQFCKDDRKKIKDFFQVAIGNTEFELHNSIRNNNVAQSKRLIEQLGTALDYSEQINRTSGASPKLLLESFLLLLSD